MWDVLEAVINAIGAVPVWVVDHSEWTLPAAVVLLVAVVWGERRGRLTREQPRNEG